MADLFRKTSLEKLSSPEQLDKMIVITPPSFWIALSGAGVIIVAALIWAIWGRLPINVETQGIYVNRDGIHSVYSETAGIIEEVLVEEGQQVKKGDIIARMDTEEIDAKLKEYADRIKAVEAVTIDSTADVVTSDNKNLMDVKNQLITVNQVLDQDLALLELRANELAEQRKETGAAEQGFLAAESAYYQSMNVGDSTSEQLQYSELQSDYATASSYLENASSGLDQAEVQYAQAEAQYKQVLGGYGSYTEAVNSITATVEQKAQSVNNAITAVSGSVSANEIVNLTWDSNPETLQVNMENGAYDSYPEIKAAATEYLGAYASLQNLESNQETIEQYKQARNAAKKTMDNYQDSVNKYSSQKNDAGSRLDDARNAYTARVQAMASNQLEQSKQGNEYNISLSEYNTQYSKLENLEDTVEQLKIQVEVDQKNVDNQMKVINEQFMATKAAIISQLEGEYKQYQQQKEQAQLRATVDGEVSNITITEGSAVNQGSVVARVQKGSDENRVVVCYVPVSSGKKIQEGMQVLIYPTTVNKQEYGHMEATVEYVDEYITSTENMQKQLGNDNLVESFLQNGPVVEVTCVLREDANTVSGYYWSSTKGADIDIASGTMVEASVVVEEKAPITMLIPLLKEKLTIQVAEENQ